MLKILIVEDEDMIRRGLVYTIDWLAMGAMIVGAAASGEEGLALLREHQPDLVITDIIMPGMSGIEMLEAAREEKLPSCKSIILTSYAEFEYARQAVKLEVSEYLLKPIDEDDLKKAVLSVKESLSVAVADVDANHAIEESLYLNFEMDSDGQNAYVKVALEKIRLQYAHKISIEAIADELQVSNSYLSRKFKEVTSQTFLEFLTKYRIQKAIALLKQGHYRVYEVSDMTGFSDYKHFCTVFKKYTHMSPKEFVKNVGAIIQHQEK